MPKYLDHHKVVPPREMVEEERKVIKSGKTDPATGIRPLNGFIAKGESWCFMEAPNAQAVHKLHESLGIKLGPGDVVEVESIV